MYKAYIDEQTFAPVKPGQGMTVAIKKLNLEGTQGHREWLVMAKTRSPQSLSMCVFCGSGSLEEVLVSVYSKQLTPYKCILIRSMMFP